jgi:hypothetical protein
LNSAVDPVTAFVVLVFATPGAALIMAGGLVILAILMIGYSDFFEHRPLMKGLRERINGLYNIGSRDRSIQQAFAARFGEMDKLMGSSLTAPPVLALGWSNWRSMLVQDDEGSFATSVRAADAFGRFDGPARSLEWWANIFVAVGLTVTFLGIVAALTQATVAMGTGGSPAVMQQALLGLLAIAATKFWTSIAGVFSSIILRLVARRWRLQIERAEAELFTGLDSVVMFAPPEKVALEQVAILRRIETSLAGAASATPDPLS